MPRRLLIVVAALAVPSRRRSVLRTGAAITARRYYTGVVEGEERVIRSEVSGRVLEVAFGEGDAVPAGRGDRPARRPRHRRAASHAKRAVAATCSTPRSRRQRGADRDASRAPGRRTSTRATPSCARPSAGGRARRDDLRARARADRAPAPARSSCSTRRAPARDQADERARPRPRHARPHRGRERHHRGGAPPARGAAPAAPSSPRPSSTSCASRTRSPSSTRRRCRRASRRSSSGRASSAQPGTPILALLDPTRQVRADLRAGRRSRRACASASASPSSSTAQPGRRVPGEISFLADRANFTPEKIETRDDRIGQVYRAKVKHPRRASSASARAPRATCIWSAESRAREPRGAERVDEPRSDVSASCKARR